MFRRILLAALVLLSPLALAEIGDPPESILEPLSPFAPQGGEGGYVAAQGFHFAFELRDGVVYRVHGDGVLEEGNVDFASKLIGAATGYGDAIAEPIRTFFETRIGELAGEGPVTLGVEAFALDLTVTGAEAPYGVEFTLSLPEVPEARFPQASHVLGPADARYVIREFSDFQCPYCAQFTLEALPEIEKALLARGDVRFEFHHFPLLSIHANAVPAAEASECAAANGGSDAFWRYHDALFERQRAWEGLSDPESYFVRLAEEQGLDGDAVASCLAARTYAAAVQDAYRTATQTLGLSGTPTVFVNGYKVQNYQQLQSYLDRMALIDRFSAGE